MLAIVKREITHFFANPMGYLVIGLFLVVNGLFLWVFDGSYNILNAGFADLSPFFELAPWVLLFLIPAVSMRSFSDERRTGTLELLLTRPISLHNIVLGKYLGAVLLIVFAILPTFLYVFTISSLGAPPGNWDVGSTAGSYIGLFFLITSYTAIGIFASTLSGNQIVAFITGISLCFLCYYGWEGLQGVISHWNISNLGMKAHFDNISRGVIDTRDVLYFVSLSILFIACTVFNLKRVPR